MYLKIIKNSFKVTYSSNFIERDVISKANCLRYLLECNVIKTNWALQNTNAFHTMSTNSRCRLVTEFLTFRIPAVFSLFDGKTALMLKIIFIQKFLHPKRTFRLKIRWELDCLIRLSCWIWLNHRDTWIYFSFSDNDNLLWKKYPS